MAKITGISIFLMWEERKSLVSTEPREAQVYAVKDGECL